MSKIPLSPIDHLFVGTGSYPIEFAFFYPNGIPRGQFQDKMADAWKKLLKSCPVANSRLVFEEGHYALKPESLDEIPWKWDKTSSSADPKKIRERYQLVSPVTTVSGETLIKMKITEGSDGATLGFSVSHAIADGFTYFSLLGAWAAFTRGEEPTPFDHQRARLWDYASDRQDSGIVGFCEAGPREDISKASIRYAHASLSRSKLNEILAQEDKGGARLSHNDVACALLWKGHLQYLSEAERNLSLVNPVDFRRILPGFPQNYAGNAVVLSRTELTRHQVEEMSIGDIARMIRGNLAKINQEYVSAAVTSLSERLKNDPRHGCDRIHIVHPQSGLLITNLSRLPLESLNFGAGAPTTCVPLTPCINTVVFTSDSYGGMEAHIQY